MSHALAAYEDAAHLLLHTTRAMAVLDSQSTIRMQGPVGTAAVVAVTTGVDVNLVPTAGHMTAQTTIVKVVLQVAAVGKRTQPSLRAPQWAIITALTPLMHLQSQREEASHYCHA